MDALRLRRTCTSERGAELVEFALTFPLLLLVVLGIIDFGLMFQRYEVLTNAAREGARVAALPGYTQANIRTRVDQYLQGAGMTPANVNMAAITPQTLTIATGVCVSVRPVTLTYVHTYAFVGGIIGYFNQSLGSKTLTATAAMRNEASATTCP
jgi:Flp pilus assembly protein TadG